MSQQQDPNGNQLNIELTEEVADGSYANLVVIQHSYAEFILDFVNIMPNTPKAKVKSRIILAPIHAKRLLRALADNVTNYESQHGTIDTKDVEMPLNFGGTTAQA